GRGGRDGRRRHGCRAEEMALIDTREFPNLELLAKTYGDALKEYVAGGAGERTSWAGGRQSTVSVCSTWAPCITGPSASSCRRRRCPRLRQSLRQPISSTRRCRRSR